MDKIEYLTKNMSHKQKEAYALICKLKHIRAERQMKKTCRILLQFGLIKHSPDSDNKNDYVLKGEPLNIPMKEKLPLKTEVVKKIKEEPGKVFQHKTIEWKPAPPPAIYSNISREQHVEKWLNAPVEVEEKPYLPVKCLEEWQMKYIMASHEQMTSKQLAEELKKEVFEVNLFCQKNAITPKRPKKKVKDVFHNIPLERQMRMKRIDYNGPQKKTA